MTTTINAGTHMISAATRSLGFGLKLAEDIPSADFGRCPVLDGKAIEANTPAFVYGHLALYPARVIELVGGDASGIEAPEAWTEWFKAGAACQNDPSNSLYPSKDELVGHFEKGTRAAMDAVAAADADVFAKIMPIERYREAFPLVGDGVNFLLNAHTMMHFGQVSFWRRCMGLGSAM